METPTAPFKPVNLTGSLYAIDPARINDDDFYLIDGNHQVISQTGSKCLPPALQEGQRVVRGMQAKWLKPAVWQLAVPSFLKSM